MPGQSRTEGYPSLTAKEHWGRYAAGMATEAVFILALAARRVRPGGRCAGDLVVLLRPRRQDHLVIGKYTGKVIVGVGLLMVVPLVTAAVFREWDTVLDFLISMAVCFIFGYGAQLYCRTEKDLAWSHGLVVASGSWIWATIFGALPHYLSGHEGSYLDAMFDVMSGYTTTGLYLLQDLDHISYGLNMWRHLLTYAGGQGIVVIALTFLFKGTAGAYKVYVGEGKDERLLPNVIQTARAIWLVSLVYLGVGTLALFGDRPGASGRSRCARSSTRCGSSWARGRRAASRRSPTTRSGSTRCPTS